MLAAMAARTHRIRIGCQVTGMPYRHPAVLANMAATVDHISGGRLILGLGAAWNEMECTAYGIPLPPLKERFDRFDEGVEAIIALLSQTVTDYDGQYVKLTSARCGQAGAAPAPADHHRRQRPQAHLAHRRPLRRGVERDNPGPGPVRRTQGSATGALRGGWPGFQRDYLLVPRAQRR